MTERRRFRCDASIILLSMHENIGDGITFLLVSQHIVVHRIASIQLKKNMIVFFSFYETSKNLDYFSWVQLTEARPLKLWHNLNGE